MVCCIIGLSLYTHHLPTNSTFLHACFACSLDLCIALNISCGVQIRSNSCNIGTSDLDDTYARSLSVAGPKG